MTRGLAVITLIALQSGCLIHSVDKEPELGFKLPDHYGDHAGSKDDADPGQWWKAFGDAELNSLVAQGLDYNLQLRQAWARVRQGDGLERSSMSELFPRIDASLSARRSRNVLNLGDAGIRVFEANNFSASIPVSYEIDLWGRVRSGMFAAEQDSVAFHADVETAALTVAANITERWFDVIQQRASRMLIEQQTEVAQKNLELVELRFQQGDAPLSDVYQLKQQVQGLDIQVINIKSTAKTADRQLAVLVGLPPQAVVRSERKDLPEPPSLPPTGIPASLLTRRPDLRAAKARVVAADYRVGEAIAARFPQITLAGAFGHQSPDIAKLLESFVWSIAAAFNANIWDGGQAGGEVDRREGVLAERLYAYQEALLNAMLEVESTLIADRASVEQITALKAQVKLAERTLELARNRYQQGVGNYLATLTALRSLQQAQQTQLTAKRQLLSQRIQLYRALGSNWTQNLKNPDDEPPPERSKAKKGTSS